MAWRAGEKCNKLISCIDAFYNNLFQNDMEYIAVRGVCVCVGLCCAASPTRISITLASPAAILGPSFVHFIPDFPSSSASSSSTSSFLFFSPHFHHTERAEERAMSNTGQQ